MRTETNAQLLAGFGVLFFVSVFVLPLMILGCNHEKKMEERKPELAKPVDVVETEHEVFKERK